MEQEFEFLERENLGKEELAMETCIYLFKFKKINCLNEKKKIFFVKFLFQ